MINILNFDSVYEKQDFLHTKKANWIDLQHIPNTNLFCEFPTLQKIASAIKPSKHQPINLIGSGNYHYITFLLLSKTQKPFSLVLFDHHTDTLESPSVDLISCGSWVLDALNYLPNLKRVLLIGGSEEAENYIPTSIEGKVRLYTKHFLRLHGKTALERIVKDIPTDEVYLSIDKDVFDKSEAITAWDHGSMRLRQALRIMKEIIFSRKVRGIDICGEYPISPINEYEKETQRANRINSDANQFLLHYITKWMKATTRSADSNFA